VLISVVTPSYNQGKYISETILSLHDQSYKSFQFIIIDGGSEDDTLAVLSKFNDLPHTLISEPDRGQAHAINKGLALATGDIFNWLNSDDVYCLDAMQVVANYFGDPGLLVLCARSIVFGLGVERLTKGSDIYLDNLPKTIGFARIDQPETFFRRQLINDVGGLDERLHYVMDRHLWIKILLKNGLNGIRKVEDVVVRFRLHEASKTVSCSNGFLVEDRQLFAGLLYSLGFRSEAMDFLGHQEVPFLDGLFPDLSGRLDAPQIASYIFLNAFLSAYAHNDIVRARWLRSVIDPTLFAIEDQQHYSKICRRMDLLPLPLKKMWNAMRSG